MEKTTKGQKIGIVVIIIIGLLTCYTIVKIRENNKAEEEAKIVAMEEPTEPTEPAEEKVDAYVPTLEEAKAEAAKEKARIKKLEEADKAKETQTEKQKEITEGADNSGTSQQIQSDVVKPKPSNPPKTDKPTKPTKPSKPSKPSGSGSGTVYVPGFGNIPESEFGGGGTIQGKDGGGDPNKIVGEFN